MRSILRRRTATLFAVTAALAVLMCGCVPEEPLPSAAPTSTRGEAPFATDDDALAAAQKTYEEFMAIANQIMAEGGASPERLDAIAAPDVVAFETQGFKKFAERNLTAGGGSTVTTAVLQSYTPTVPDGAGIIVGYFCVDGSGITVVDESGTSVVDQSRPALSAFEITFDLAEKDPPRLVVSSKKIWDGAGVC